MPGGSDCRKQPVDMKQFKVACSLFSIAVCTVAYGTLCLFSDAACCSLLSVTSQHINKEGDVVNQHNLLVVLFDYTTLLISYTHNGDNTHKEVHSIHVESKRGS